GDDSLIAGRTSFDDRIVYSSHEVAWAALFAEWKRTDHSFQQRVDSLFGSGVNFQANRSNGPYYLNDNTITDVDTDTVEILTGSSGEDWYLYSSKDKLTGLDATETAEKELVS